MLTIERVKAEVERRTEREDRTQERSGWIHKQEH